ncbi:MAG TPA: 2-oxo-tetronate isomerase [Acetobacteraceae bacterium]|nr:2-oxo-tetronate isomerase [Acetobacteraceae bacterium]
MPRLAANLSMMFNEVPFLDRFERAAKAGFTAVEYLFPYEFLAPDIAARLKANGLAQVLFNGPPGNWAAGERGLAAIPGREAEFREGFSRALDYAAALGCPRVHVMAGILPPGVAHLTAASVYAANLAWAGEQAGRAGVKVLLEPINHHDMPGYFLNTTRQAAEIIAGIGGENIALQFDIYHCQITEGDVTRRIAALLPLIAHMQIADVPERHEPGTGEIGWEFVFKRIDALGYSGYVGCEYRPAGETEAGLGWRARFGI